MNTCPVLDGEPMELLADFAALLRWFQEAEVLSPGQVSRLSQQWGGSAQARRTVEAMRRLRETLRKEVLTMENGGTVHHAVIDEVNRLMSEHPMLIRLKTTGNVSSMELWFDPRRPEDLFAPLAHGAATLFAGADRNRIRKCGQCVLHFYDTSKKGTRRWCSMQLCGNRLKVAAYAARQRRLNRNPSARGPRPPTAASSGGDRT